MLIFGVDTGSIKCGYAVLRVDGSQIDLMECGVITTSKPANDNGVTMHKWMRMHDIADDFAGLLAVYGAALGDVCAIESAYVPVGRPWGVETLAEARGALAYVAGNFKLRIVTVAPSTVKKAVTGSGKADKAQVAEMVRKRFKLRTAPPADASDAVGVALAVAQGAGK